MNRARDAAEPRPYVPADMASRSERVGRVYIGVSGYHYPEWRGPFYPPDMRSDQWFGYATRRFDSIELNGTFYSLKSPSAFARWASEADASGCVLAVKGSRFITHNRKLAGARGALANFYASGVLALGERTGPFLWQLPPAMHFDAERLEAFLDLLPRDTASAERLARDHDPDSLRRGALTDAAAHVPYRHAFEIRHPSFVVPAFFDLLARRASAFVIADTAGLFPYVEAVTADFVYVRLHGSEVLYASRYTDDELAAWAARIEAWAKPASRGGPARDVYVYFDNTAKGFAPSDALRLAALVAARGLARPRTIRLTSRGGRGFHEPPKGSP